MPPSPLPLLPCFIRPYSKHVLFAFSYLRPIGEIDLRQAQYAMQSREMRVLVKMPFAIEISTPARLWVKSLLLPFESIYVCYFISNLPPSRFA